MANIVSIGRANSQILPEESEPELTYFFDDVVGDLNSLLAALNALPPSSPTRSGILAPYALPMRALHGIKINEVDLTIITSKLLI